MSETKNIYLPERVFVRNLFELCNCNNQDFLNQINNSIYSEIQDYVQKLKSITENLESSDSISIYPSSFRMYVIKYTDLIKCTESSQKKMPNYFLLECYLKIKEAYRFVLKNNPKFINHSDSNYLKNFEDIINVLTENDYGALSQRQLQRLLDISGNRYENKQKKIMHYIISRVISEILLQQNEINYLCSNWKQVLLYYGDSLEQKIFIQGNDNVVEIIENVFKEKFNNVSKMDKRNYKEIGNALWEIYNEIINQYNCNSLSHYQEKSKYQNEKNMNTDNYSYEYTTELSSHILGFMRWLPIISDEDSDFQLLVAIESVSEKIEISIKNDYCDIINIKALKQCKNGKLFIEDNETDEDFLLKIKSLRELLIATLCDNDYIRSKFYDFYKMSGRA